WVELTFLQDLGDDDVQLAYAALRAALAREELAAVLADDLLGILVGPGQVLAVLHPPTDGEAGTDVRGNPLSRPGAPAELRAGEHVRSGEQGFAAEVFGYACHVDGEISVLSPVWVSPDRLEAHFVHFPQPRAATLRPDWLLAALRARGVTGGLDEPAVEQLCAAPPAASAKVAVAVARGTPAVDGADGHVAYAIDMEKRSGKLQADGSVDLRERNAAVGVTAGQVIGELVPPTAGQPGQNLLGEILPARDGQERAFSAGEGVKLEPGDGGRQRFVAEVDGAVSLGGDTLQVRPVFTVSGDIDYNTGNLDLPANVEISGSVRSGFTVRAGGSVTVGGTVEPGAQVHARGDVVVAKGIFGDATKVVALGSLTTKFVQNSTVLAHGSVTVGAYIIHGRVRAGGEVRVESGGGSRGGSIIGGEVIAGGGIAARLIGSGEGDRALVGIGASPEQAARLARLRQQLRTGQLALRKIVVRLGLDSESEEDVQRLLRRPAPAARRRLLEEAAAELRRLRDERDAAQQGCDDLEAQVEESLRRAWVRASDKVGADVQVQFGREVRTVSSEVVGAEFFKGDEGIRWRPLLSPGGDGQ
ncbi:MAG: FapA family protein, partial [Gemmatimonadota bacterium]